MARFLGKLALAFKFLALASTASAGINEWTSVGPEGGDIIDVAVTNTTPAVAAYALTPSAVYRSNDMGQTWSQTAWIGYGFASDLAVHPPQPDRLVIASGGGVLVSSNGGVTFYLLNPPAASIPLQRVAFSEDGAHLYASDRNALYRSSDFGATWTTGATVGPTTNSYSLPFQVDPTNPHRVIARVEGGLSISDDAGAHWTPTIGVPATFVADVAFDRAGGRIWAATPEGLWHSSDNVNWTMSLTASVSKVTTIRPTRRSYTHTTVPPSIAAPMPAPRGRAITAHSVLAQ